MCGTALGRLRLIFLFTEELLLKELSRDMEHSIITRQ